MPKAQGNGKPVNRSDAVREELAKNPKVGSKELIEALAGRGIKVSPTLVYYVKSKQGKARRKAKRDRVAAASAKAAPNPLELVIRLKDLAREVGGFKNLKQLVDLLAE
jgi:hypothetical protein